MRVYNYILIIMGLMILFNYAGIQTVSNKILTEINIIDNPGGFTLTDFFKSTYNIVGLLVVAGAITLGFYMRTSPESYLLVGYTATLMLFVADIIGIITYAQSNYSGWISAIVTLLLGGVALGYLHSVISWWGNKA